MKTMITFLAGLLFIVNSSGAQQETQTLIALPVNPAAEQAQVDGPSNELVACEMILGGQSNLPQGIAFQDKTSLAHQQSKARPHSEFIKNGGGLNRRQRTSIGLLIGGAIPIIIGSVMISTVDSKDTNEWGNSQGMAGALLVLAGTPFVIIGGVNLLVSSIRKARGN